MLNITADHYSFAFCYFLQINEVHRNDIWGAYQAIGGDTIKANKTKRGEVSGFSAVYDPWTVGWLILMVSLKGQNKLRDVPLGRPVRAFPGA